MSRPAIPAAILFVAAVALPRAESQAPLKADAPAPRLEPVAETKLLMEGLAKANFDGLDRLLRDKPTTAEQWRFARGQALIVAETGNLLLMRPPKTRAAQDLWMKRATELRDAAVALAKSAGGKDFAGSRAGLAALANACNRCHEGFRVTARIVPFADER
jgi:Cytochrome C'